ncbi:PP2C family serine/threonine-protein phosphatase [Paenibacillus sp. GCM10023248]|nr:PP2C family serine/threonine-protein phosphatase [Paenibacillus sp. MAHUQ-63]
MAPYRWCAITVSQIGPGHVHDGMPNQDAVCVLPIDDDMVQGLAISVADGLGTCMSSDIGSAFAVRVACEQLGKHFRRIMEIDKETNELWNIGFGISAASISIVTQWRAWCGLQPNELKDYSSTCLVAGSDGRMVCVGQLGDGLAVALMEDRDYRIVGKPRTTFSNITESLSDTNAVDKWSWSIFDAGDIPLLVFLATDGISDDLDPEMISEFLNQLYDDLCRDGAEVLNARLQEWLRDWPTEGHSDDKSLAILFRIARKEE